MNLKKYKDDARKLVSVIMPTYNRGYCIEKSIFSVLDQTYHDLELIIVDDASEDDTREVVSKIADPRVRYYRNEKNLGAAASRNVGLRYAKGEVIAFNDSDDLWRQGKLEKQMEVMTETGAEIVYCYLERNRGGEKNLIPPDVGDVSHLSGNIFRLMLERNVMALPSVVLTKKCIDEYGGFNEDMRAVEDYELFLKCVKNNKVIFVKDVLVDSFDYGDGINDEYGDIFNIINGMIMLKREFEEDIDTFGLDHSFKDNLVVLAQKLGKEEILSMSIREMGLLAEELLKHNQKLTDRIKDCDATIQQLNEWHWEKDKTIQQLNEWHWEKDKTIQQLNERIRDLETKIERQGEL